MLKVQTFSCLLIYVYQLEPVLSHDLVQLFSLDPWHKTWRDHGLTPTQIHIGKDKIFTWPIHTSVIRTQSRVFSFTIETIIVVWNLERKQHDFKIWKGTWIRVCSQRSSCSNILIIISITTSNPNYGNRVSNTSRTCMS